MIPTTAASQSRPGAAGGFSAARVAALLAVLVLAAFPQVALGLQSFVIRDFGFFAYPLAHFQRECFWRGELPLWNPYNACGVPFLAQWNTMALYPPALLYLLLPLSWGLNLFCLLHLWFGGLGAFFLARRWTGHGPAAALAGVAFAFNGMTLNLLMWPSHIATFAWMPWVVLAVERAWREGGRRLLPAAAASALQLLAGGPETILFTWSLLLAMWICDMVRGAGRAGGFPETALSAGGANAGWRWRVSARFAVVALLAVLLAAAQLLPFLDLAAHSQRQLDYADTRWSMPARGWANFLVPMAFGHVSNLGIFVQHGQGWTSSYYPGMGVLLLALAAGVARCRPMAIGTADAPALAGSRTGLLGIAAAAAVVLALGDQTPLYRALRGVVPQLSLMTYPVKFLLVAAFALPLLAARGLVSLAPRCAGSDTKTPQPPVQTPPFSNGRKWLAGLAALLLGLMVAVAILAWRAPAPGEDVRLTWYNGLSRAAILVATAALLLAWMRPGSSRLRQLAPWTLLLLVWLDALTHQPNQNPTAPPWIYQSGLARQKLALQPEPALGQSRAMVAPETARRFREIVLASAADNFIVKRLGLFANCNLLDALPKVDGFFSLYPRQSDALIGALYSPTSTAGTGLLDFLGVSQLTAPGQDVNWQPRATYLPWVTGGQQPVFVEGNEALEAVLRPDFDPRRFVYLPLEAAERISVRAPVAVRVRNVNFGMQRVEFDVHAAEPALVVVAQTWYHWWRARVDGQPAAVLQANYAFQAVAVPAGEHRVVLEYRDKLLVLGAAVSAAAWIGCAAGWMCRRRVRQIGEVL